MSRFVGVILLESRVDQENKNNCFTRIYHREIRLSSSMQKGKIMYQDLISYGIVAKKNTSICRRSVLRLIRCTRTKITPSIAYLIKKINSFEVSYA